MNARILGALFAFGLVLAAAAHADPLVDHPTITVTVVQGQIHVSEDPVKSLPTEGAFSWQLPADSGYAFSQDGIAVASPGLHKCYVNDDKKQLFRCDKKRHVHNAQYKYTITLVPTGSGQAPPPLDPIIFDY
jgi:hypothetical protein